MTPEAQRIAIAKSQGRIESGWYCKHCHCDVQDDHVTFGETHDVRAGGCGESVSGYGLPDYLNDLNAMHEAVMSLPANQRVEFRKQLQYIVAPRTKPSRAGCLVLMGDKEYDAWFNATAAQRAEAFLKTLNLWTDEQ